MTEASRLPVRVGHGSVGHWAIRGLWVAAVAAFVVYIPWQAATSTVESMSTALQLAIAVMALNLVMGYGGTISIGHSAFFGIGAFTTGVLVDHYGWTQGWTLYVAAVFGFVIGCLLSLPALRLTGPYLALVTLGFAVLFPAVIRWNKLETFTDRGIPLGPLQYGATDFPILGEMRGREDRAVLMFWMSAVVLAICYLVCRGIVKSRVGRSLIALRDNQTAAAVMGINRTTTKTIVFGISAAMTAVAGSLYAIQANQANIDDRMYLLIGSVIFLLVMVLGGAATLWGPIIGAIAFQVLETNTRDAARQRDSIIGKVFGWMNDSPAGLVLAIVLLVLMFVAPFGVIGLLKRLAARAVVLVPALAGSGAAATVAVAIEDIPPPDEPFHEDQTGSTPP